MNFRWICTRTIMRHWWFGGFFHQSLRLYSSNFAQLKIPMQDDLQRYFKFRNSCADCLGIHCDQTPPKLSNSTPNFYSFREYGSWITNSLALKCYWHCFWKDFQSWFHLQRSKLMWATLQANPATSLMLSVNGIIKAIRRAIVCLQTVFQSPPR